MFNINSRKESVLVFCLSQSFCYSFFSNFGVDEDPSSYFTFHQQAASTGSTSVMEIWAEGNGMKWKTSSNIFTFETGLIWPFVILSKTELLKYTHPLLWPYITVIYHHIFSVGWGCLKQSELAIKF